MTLALIGNGEGEAQVRQVISEVGVANEALEERRRRHRTGRSMSRDLFANRDRSDGAGEA